MKQQNEFTQLWKQNCDYMEVIDTCCKDATYPDEIDERRLDALYRVIDETKEWQQTVLNMLAAND